MYIYKENISLYSYKWLPQFTSNRICSMTIGGVSSILKVRN